MESAGKTVSGGGAKSPIVGNNVNEVKPNNPSPSTTSLTTAQLIELEKERVYQIKRKRKKEIKS